MLYRGLMFSAASGKLNGVVWSHNHGGPYVRSNSYPTDPQTARQVQCRTALGVIYEAWTQNLTSAERDEWERYARSRPRANRIGEHGPVSGWAAFTTQYFLQQQAQAANFGSFNIFPGIPSMPQTVTQQPDVVLSTDRTEVHVYWTSDWYWEGEASRCILIYLSTPQPATVNFFKGPYRLLAVGIGSEVVPLAQPIIITLPTPAQGDQRIFFRIRTAGSDFPPYRPFVGRARYIP